MAQAEASLSMRALKLNFIVWNDSSQLDRPRGLTIALPGVSGAANVEAECARCGAERGVMCHHLGQRSDAAYQLLE